MNQHIVQRLTQLQQQIRFEWPEVVTLEQLRIWEDLNQILGNCEDIYRLLQMEMVECRRLHKSSIRYQECENKLTSSLEVLEHHVTLAILLG